MSIQEMREKRAAKAREYRKLLDENTGVLSAEVTKDLDTIHAEITGLDETIKRHEKALEMEAESRVVDAAAQVAADKPENARAQVFMKFLRNGTENMTSEERQILRNTMSTGDGSQGGYTVPTQTSRNLIDALKSFGGMRDVATIFSTDNGQEIQYPTSDGTSEEGEIVGENSPASSADPNFGTKSLVVHKFSSKVVAVPFELLQDSTIDIESFINKRLAQRLARITNRMFTVGTGSGQPTGIVTAVGIGVTGDSGQDDNVSWEKMIDLEHSVDPAYRQLGNCRYMFHDNTLRELKKLKDEQNRPLWLPGVATKEPDTFNGYPFTINQSMAPMAANARSILFGDFSYYVIRDAMQILYRRYTDSAYDEKGQVGFLAWLRSGGNFMDVGGAVKAFKNAAA